jgi:NADH:ubiquinone oxidoreductase subunit 5 (subunit L)/multisubunit Na+/H+ antiporter MnhA subunit
MEGPTPVSALLHAATMVTAGVYLVIRFSFIIEFSPVARALMFFGGYLTVIFSSFMAMTQYDIKKIIAYSTCSQLGLMFFSCGLSGYDYALYHFFNHAFFKCLLFLLAGAIIHQLGNEQDIRRMGGLIKKMPATFIAFFVASLSLAGFPMFSGATSKDLILHLANYTAANTTTASVSIFLFSSNIIVYLTVAYSARLLYYVFVAKPSYRSAFNAGFGDFDPFFKEPVYGFIFSFLTAMSVGSGAAFAKYFTDAEDGRYVNIHNEMCQLGESYIRMQSDSSYSFVATLCTASAMILAACWIYRARNRSVL